MQPNHQQTKFPVFGIFDNGLEVEGRIAWNYLKVIEPAIFSSFSIAVNGNPIAFLVLTKPVFGNNSQVADLNFTCYPGRSKD